MSRSERRLGRFTLVGVAGRGPRGVVYEAYDDEGARAALKVMLQRADPGNAGADDPVGSAWSAGSLEHPNLVRVIERGFVDERPYLALDWLAGGSLAGLIARRRGGRGGGALPDAKRTLRWMRDAVRGLRYLHDRGLAHGNLKPGNFLLDAEGALRLSDPGAPGSGDGLPAAPLDRPLASVAYRAPEHLPRGVADEPGDVYALGVCFYELLTGELPHEAPDEEAYVDAVCSRRVPALRSRRRDVPRWVDALLQRCLEPDPARRFADAAALDTALQGQRQVPGTGRGILGRATSFLKRRPGGSDRGDSH